MPVLATMATIHFLFGSEAVGFLNPDGLREACKDSLDDPDTRAGALGLVDELDSNAARYNAAAEDSLAKYAADSRDWNSSTEQLLQTLQPLDLQRKEAINGVIAVRQAMLALLDEDEWRTVFG